MIVIFRGIIIIIWLFLMKRTTLNTEEAMDDKKVFHEGDPVFAKVKGFVPYPARILGRAEGVKKLKFSVLFYETNEKGDIGMENLWPVTIKTVEKLVTQKTLRKKDFEPALKEMCKCHTEVTKFFPEIVRLAEHEGLEIFDNSEEVAPGKSEDPLQKLTCLPFSEDDNQENLNLKESFEDDDDAEAHCNDDDDIEEEFCCNECGLILDSKGALVSHAVDHVVAEKIASIEARRAEQLVTENDDIESFPSHSGMKTQVKRSKVSAKVRGPVKKALKAKKTMTLRENELEVNDAFADKIVVKEDGNFHCKNCPTFITSVRLLARSHANVCGGRKTVGRKVKKFSCDDCGEVVKGKKNLQKHIKKMHTMPTYQCSTCLKRLKSRVTYRRHLKTHDNNLTIACPHCPKMFRYESYKNRHVYRVHIKSQASIINAKVVNDTIEHNEIVDTNVQGEVIEVGVDDMELNQNQNEIVDVYTDVTGDVIEIVQQEVKSDQSYFWQYEVSIPNTDRINGSTCQMFSSSLEVSCEDDWNAWIQISKAFNINVSADGSNDAFETAYIREANGSERIVCAGSEVPTNIEFVKVIVDEVVTAAVAMLSDIDTYGIEEILDEMVETGAGTSGDVEEEKQPGSEEKKVTIENILSMTELECVGGAPIDSAGTRAANAANHGENDTADVEEGTAPAGGVDDGREGTAHAGDGDGGSIRADDDNGGDDGRAGQVDAGGENSIDCDWCSASGFRNRWFLRRHLNQMHAESVKCNICGNIFLDKYHYLQHSKNCYYWCSRAGCGFHERRKSRVESHEKKHDREV